MSRARVVSAIAITLACVIGGIAYLSLQARSSSSVAQELPDLLSSGDGTSASSNPSGQTAPTEPRVEPLGGRGTQLVYISRADDHYGKVVVAAGSPPVPLAVDVECARIHVAADRVICLEGGVLGAGGDGRILDRRFEEVGEFGLGGIPSRARLSPDGTAAAFTLFVTGHSYTGGAGTFSTFTAIIDVATNRQTNLEEFRSVAADGTMITTEDRNYWGVTFAKDPNRFFATMATGGSTYLMEGDRGAMELRVVSENAECPSISPDERHLLFKVPEGGGYRLVLYEIATGTRTDLDAAGPVDDQIEWLDDDTILYAVARTGERSQATADIWSLDIAPGAEPQLVVADAESPAVVRA